MELIDFSHVHFIQAIKDGLVEKIVNVNSGGRPKLRFKLLKAIYESEDAKNIGSSSLFQQQEAAFTGSPFVCDRFKTEMEFRPMVDKTVKSDPETWELNEDCIYGTRSVSEDLSFPDTTLRELRRRCKAKRTKLTKSNGLENQDIGTCSSPDGISNVQPNGDDSDLEVSISSLMSKLSKKPKSKRKCIRKCVFTSSETAASREAFAEQISYSPKKSMQTIMDTNEAVNVKSELFEPDCNVVYVADLSTCISYLDKDFGGEMSHEVPSRVNGGLLRVGESTSLTEESPSCVVNEVSSEYLEINGELGTGESTSLTEESPSCVVNEVSSEYLEIGVFGTGESTSLPEESPSCVVNEVSSEYLEIGELGTGESTFLTEESPSCVFNEVSSECLEIGELGTGESTSLPEESPSCVVNKVPSECLEIGELGIGESTFSPEESPSCVVNEVSSECMEICELGTGESTSLPEESPSCVVNEVSSEYMEIGELGTGESTSLPEESPSCVVNEVPFECLEIGELGIAESTSLTEDSPSCVVNEVAFEYLEIGELLSLPISDAEIVEGTTKVELPQMTSQESLSSPVSERMKEGNIVDPISLCSPAEAVASTMDPGSEIYRSCKDDFCSQGISCLMDNDTVTQMSEMSIDDNLECLGQSSGGDGCDSEMRGEGDGKEDAPPSFQDNVNNFGSVYIPSQNSNPCFSLPTDSDSVDHCSPTVEKYSLATDEQVSAVVGAVDCSSEFCPDATNRLTVTEAIESDRCPQLEYPSKRLFSTRKAISPSSQEKLRHAVDADELYDNIEHSRLGLEGAKVTISPDGVLKKRKIVKNGSSQLVSKGILKAPNVSFVIPHDGTECASIHTCAQKAVAFSQRQMHDIEGLAMKLMRQLKSMKEIVEETLLTETLHTDSCSSTHLKYAVDKMRMATENAAEAEETTKRWLSMMARDCTRFCKIMRSTEKKAVAGAGAGAGAGAAASSHEVHKERRKITFADEAGGILCQVKVFEDHPASLSVPEGEKVNQEKLTKQDASACTLHS